jgi:hypothetical protein
LKKRDKEQKMSNELATTTQNELGTGLFANGAIFGQAYEMAEKLSKSTLLPEAYRNKPENVFVALEIAQRRGISPLAVMQNLYVIQGRPAWSSAYVLTAVNISGIYVSSLKFTIADCGNKTVQGVNIRDMSCVATAVERATGNEISGPLVSVEMAVKEGWYGKQGSKWKTMPELMLRYRAAAFFVRTNCPEVIEGLHAADEVEDAQIIDAPAVTLVTPHAPLPLTAPAPTPTEAESETAPTPTETESETETAPTLAKPRRKKTATETTSAPSNPAPKPPYRLVFDD